MNPLKLSKRKTRLFKFLEVIEIKVFGNVVVGHISNMVHKGVLSVDEPHATHKAGFGGVSDFNTPYEVSEK